MFTARCMWEWASLPTSSVQIYIDLYLFCPLVLHLCCRTDAHYHYKFIVTVIDVAVDVIMILLL